MSTPAHKRSDVESEDNKMDTKEHETGGAKEPTPDPTVVPGEEIGDTKTKESPVLAAPPETKANSEAFAQTCRENEQKNLELLQTNLSFVHDEFRENIHEAIAHNAGDVIAVLAGTAVGFNFFRTGQPKEALCTAGVVLTMMGSRFLTEGAVMHYYRNTYRRNTPPTKEAGSPWVSIGLGVAGIGAGCCYLAGLFTPSK